MAVFSTQQPPLPDSDTTLPQGPTVYRCGTLKYVKLGLFTLFSWLLWGDFCFTLMETVTGTTTSTSILPIKLKALGASNLLMGVILTSLPGILNMTICPWVSFRSDRHRGRLGRRIPFILSTMPFLAISLILLGWSEDLVPLLQRWIPPLASVAPATIAIFLIAMFFVTFQFFNMFVNSVYWYLFNDVVPPQFLGRFFGLFRLVGYGAAAIYNYFIFRYAATNMREIFTGGALIYVFGVGLMCLFVKEGKYPPPPDKGNRGLLEGMKDFAKQSFSCRFYWYFYLMKAFAAMALASTMYMLFFNQEMGLSNDQIGKLAAYALLAGMLATYFTAVLVDRWHPLRISAYLAVFMAVTGLGSWVWIFVTLPGNVFFWVSLGTVLVSTFGMFLRDGCEIPTFMRLMPKSLYGQLSSANSIIRSIANIVAGVLCGASIDIVKRLCHGSDFAYRFIFIWPWFFNTIAAVFICIGYREWKRLGGDEHYRPPAPWTKDGFEEVHDRVPFVPAIPRYVMISMWLGVLGSAINVALVLIFMYFMAQHGLKGALAWYAMFFIPIKLLLTALSYWQLVWVRRDIAARNKALPTRYGIPHHGVLLVNAIQGLMFFPVFWYQTAKMIELNLGYELILFGVASLISTAMTIVGVQILRWIEREPAKAEPAAQAA